MRKELIIEKKFAEYMDKVYGGSIKNVTEPEKFEIKQAFMMGAAAMSSQYIIAIKEESPSQSIITLIESHTPYFNNFADYNKPPEDIHGMVTRDKWKSN